MSGKRGRRDLTGTWIGSIILVSFGVVVLLVTLLSGRTSPRGWITDNYTRVSAGTYSSPHAPLAVAGQIANRYRTSERVYTPNGVFLRYRNVVVGVLPDGRGSRITLDTPERGYARYHTWVGGNWGGPGGRASTFRGGGPGEGK